MISYTFSDAIYTNYGMINDQIYTADIELNQLFYVLNPLYIFLS